MLAWINLGLCVAATGVLLVGLRATANYKIDLTAFIGFNYLAAAISGLISFPQAFEHVFAHKELAILALMQGAGFFGLFTIMGILSHKVGLGYMTIVSKMSLVIPVLLSWLLFGDDFTWLHFAGVLLAIGAILLVNFGESETPQPLSSSTSKWQIALLSILLFLGSGLNDTFFKYLNVHFSGLVDNQEYVIVLFAAAALASTPVILYKALKGSLQINPLTAISGLLIGIPNYFSIVFLTASLQFFDGTVFYPLNNTAILLLMALVGIVGYNEALNRWKLMGLGIAAAAVVMLV